MNALTQRSCPRCDSQALEIFRCYEEKGSSTLLKESKKKDRKRIETMTALVRPAWRKPAKLEGPWQAEKSIRTLRADFIEARSAQTLQQ